MVRKSLTSAGIRASVGWNMTRAELSREIYSSLCGESPATEISLSISRLQRVQWPSSVILRSEKKRDGVAWAQVPHGRRALARLSANFYKRPAERLAVSGITGTNGKSTTSFLLESILAAAGRKSALIGTIEYHVAGKILSAPHTTPEALELNRILNEALGQGATEAVMEVSSHALEQQRVYGIPFDVAVFSNLTRDHLDYHHTMEEYFSLQNKFCSKAVEPNRRGRR